MADDCLQTTILQGYVDRIRAGDRAARDELLRVVVGRLERVARQMLRKFPSIRRWTETEDVLQSSLLRLLRALESVEVTSTRGFFGLAATQMRRELIDLARHYHGPLGEAANRAPVSLGTQEDQMPEPAAPTSAEEELDRWHRFHVAVESLPVEERELVSLVYYHGWTQAQVAELFQVSERTVRRRWEAALARLHGMLQGEEG